MVLACCFCGSNTKIGQTLKQVIRKNPKETVFIFLDVVPQNLNTVRIYEKLCSSSIYQEHTNIHVIPIFCIEYYACLLIRRLQIFTVTARIEDIVEFIFNQNYDYELTAEHKMQNNIEHWLKFVLEEQYECLQNKLVSDKRKHRGKFYNHDCPSSDCFMDSCTCSEIRLEYKAELLYLLLPVSLGDERYSEHLAILGINCIKCDIDEAYRKLIKQYKDICNSLNVDFKSLMLLEDWR